MTIGEWLETRTPLPPPALAGRLRTLLEADLSAGEEEIPRRFLAASERLMAGLLDAPAGSRSAALDLLAADALVTYAVEAASDDLDRLDEAGSTAIARLSAMVRREDAS